jgi:hypothetical protein
VRDWDEADEPQGWGEFANTELLDAVEAGLAGLRRYADGAGEMPGPTTGELFQLLDEAARDADDYVESEDMRRRAEAAVESLRAELAATPATFAVAA